jgi:hypothetical protein
MLSRGKEVPQRDVAAATGRKERRCYQNVEDANTIKYYLDVA